ncbi:uronate isomerase [Lucifera butyrica]|uniref:Uronate isomerase n=2 Tax=Lucifera butyrica TaxID=1351585 RepID=A0A498RE68_9FIRM|nr:uronate isomerase [Lucifera butyrica]
MDEDFLLETETAKRLFHEYAEKMPIIDYHCHISPQEIAENHKFKSITEAWLGGDHYKWRLIRSNGTPESKITGKESSDWEKFLEYVKALSRAIGNPLYHWSHLELKRYFHCDMPLNEKTAAEIFRLCNQRLQAADMGVQGIIAKSNVKVICTTDDPVDDLKWHKKLKEEGSCAAKVFPAMRPDKAMGIEKAGFTEYMTRLAEVSGIAIKTMDDIRQALSNRIAFFAEMGCRATDHALKYVFCREAEEAALDQIVAKALAGAAVSVEEEEAYKTALLTFLAGEYSKRGWVMQIHYATLRDNNTNLFRQLGPDTGFDCIASCDCGEGLVALLDRLNQKGILPKTVLYSGNPADNALIGTIIGSFQGPEAKGKIQQGTAWWFNDTQQGMIDQMTSIANLSVFGNILGMLTDSRSFLSYTRHEYYRRILCNWIGNLVENGQYPADMESLGKMVEDICYHNAANYFQFAE